ncbi:MAG: translation initiation factor IF-2 [Nanoarchaeota archaeon]|nr:translation initiation factor IF-2 [Nanoarchaeota archaeon]
MAEKEVCSPQVRSIICTVIGHVDHGKTSLLDNIRGTAIVKGEAGAITQAIGASFVPIETIRERCKTMLAALQMKFTVPGVLFIDTPGHAAFTNLRKRGGNLADIAILVIDMNEGFKPQTLEAIEILKKYKTPFVIAANKVDLIKGWRSNPKIGLMKNIMEQNADVQKELDERLYRLVGQLYDLGFNSERFDRVDDYQKNISMIPTSAKTGEGLPELLMVVAGLAQKYLEKGLECNKEGNAKGTILEVKETKGIGKTIDVILYNGHLKIGDTIVIGNVGEPIVTKIKSLFVPEEMSEMRDKKTLFKHAKIVCAAAGVRISANDIDNVISGMPLVSCLQNSPINNAQNLESAKDEVRSDIDEVFIETEKDGVIIKADSLGSLEALITLLKEKNIKIRKAMVGDISKKDISDAESIFDKDPLMAVVLGFNVAIPRDVVVSQNVHVITNDVIYKIIEDFEKWTEDQKKLLEKRELERLIKPGKVKLMPGYVFRQNNPAVVGMEVLSGIIKPKVELMKAGDARPVTAIKSIQLEKESVHEAKKGQQVAVALENVTVGRQINEGDIFLVYIPEEVFRKYKEFKSHLSDEDRELLKEISDIMRKQNPVWGV